MVTKKAAPAAPKKALAKKAPAKKAPAKKAAPAKRAPAKKVTSITQVVGLPGTPAAVYAALTNPKKHAAFSGGKVTGAAKVGGRMTAWSGYIEATYLALEPGARIAMTWSTAEWPEGATPSIVEITLRPTDDGTLLLLEQTGVPAGDVVRYDEGWGEFYWKPLRAWLQKER